MAEWEVQESSLFKVLMVSLMDSMRQFGNIFYIILMVLTFSFGLVEENIFLVFPLLANFTMKLLKTIYLYSTIIRRCRQQIDERIYLKVDFNTGKKPRLVEVKGVEVSVGDILLLKKKERCPADILLLDCKDDWSFVNTTDIDGVSQQSLKKPLILINANKKDMKAFLTCYKQYFTGRIEYGAPKRSEKEFTGYLKLQNDPKGQNLAFENLILRGSILKYSDWIVGLVVSNGREITSLSQLQSTAYDLKFKVFLNRFMQMSFIWTAIGILTTSVWRSLQESSIVREYGSSGHLVEILKAISSFSTQAPIMIYALIDISHIVYKISTERQFNANQKQTATTSPSLPTTAHASGTRELVICNPDSMTNFCHLDYAVFGHHGVITQKDQEEIVGLIYDGNFFTAIEQPNKDDELIKTDSNFQQIPPFPNPGGGGGEKGAQASSMTSPEKFSNAFGDLPPRRPRPQPNRSPAAAASMELTQLMDLSTIPINNNNPQNNITKGDTTLIQGNQDITNNFDQHLLQTQPQFMSRSPAGQMNRIFFTEDKGDDEEKPFESNLQDQSNIVNQSKESRKQQEEGEEVIDANNNNNNLVYFNPSHQQINEEDFEDEPSSQSHPVKNHHLFVSSQRGTSSQVNQTLSQSQNQSNHLAFAQQLIKPVIELRTRDNLQGDSACSVHFTNPTDISHLDVPSDLILQNNESDRSIPYEKSINNGIPSFIEHIEDSPTRKKTRKQLSLLSDQQSQFKHPTEFENNPVSIPSLLINDTLLNSMNDGVEKQNLKNEFDDDDQDHNNEITSKHAKKQNSIEEKRSHPSYKYQVIRPQAIDTGKQSLTPTKELNNEINNSESQKQKEITNFNQSEDTQVKEFERGSTLQGFQIQSRQSNGLETPLGMQSIGHIQSNDVISQFEVKQKKYIQREIYKYSDYSFKSQQLIEKLNTQLSLKDVLNDLEVVDAQVNQMNQSYASVSSTTRTSSAIAADFIKSIVLCHQIKTKKPAVNFSQGDEKIVKHDLSTHEESILLRLASILDVPFVYSGSFNSKKYYQIKFKSKEYRFEIKGINMYSQKRGRFSIILKEETQLDLGQAGGILGNHSPYSPLNGVGLHHHIGSLLHHQFGHLNPSGQPASATQNGSQFMLVRGDEKSMLRKCVMSKAAKDKLDKLLHSFSMNGMHFIVYAKRMVTTNQLSDFKKRVQMASPTEAETLIDNFESDLSLLGIVCLRQRMAPSIHQTIDILRNSNVTCWVLSGDKQQKVLAAALQAEVVPPNAEFLQITQTDYEELKFQIKSHLLQVQKLILKEDSDTINPPPSYKSKASQVRTRRLSSMVGQKGHAQVEDQMNRLVIQVSGASLMHVLADDYLKSHFAFLCMICKSVIGYNFSFEQKARMTQLLHESFVLKPTVMTIGATWGDSWMLNIADVSVQIDPSLPGVSAQFPRNRITHLIGDVVVSDLSDFKKIVLDSSLDYQEKLKYLVILCFRFSFFFTVLNYVNALHSYQLYSSSQSPIVFTHFLQVLFSGLFLISGKLYTTRSNMIKVYPTFYASSKNYFSWTKAHFIDTIIIGGIQAFVIQMVMEDALFTNNSVDGKLRDKTTVSELVAIMSTVTFIIMSQFASGTFSILSRIIHLTSMLLTLVFTYSWDSYEGGREGIPRVRVSYFFKESNVWICLVSMTALASSIEIFYQKILRQLLQNKDVRQFIKQQSENIRVLDIITDGVFQQFIKMIKQRPTLDHYFYANLFKALFSEVEMDGFLRKIIDPGEKVENLSGINKLTLKFKDERLEQSFRAYKLKLVYTIYLLPITIMSAILSISTIAYIIRNTNRDLLNIIIDVLRFLVEFVFTIGYSAIFFAKTNLHFAKLNRLILMNIRGLLGSIVGLYALSVILYQGSTTNDMLQEHLILFSVLSWDIIPPPLIYQVALNLINFISLIIYITAMGMYANQQQSLIAYYKASISIIFFFYCILNIGSYYNKDKLRRDLFLMENIIKNEENKVDQVLANLLPSFVRTRFNRNGETNIEEDQGEVAILFIEIVSFDDIIKEQDETFIQWLDHLYRSFDYVSQRYGIQKIETVGKVYMACSGLDVAKPTNNLKNGNEKIWEENETKKALDAAFAIQKRAQKIYWGVKSSKTILKIGIHYGRVIAGVIGYHKPQFSLIGDTVNTTSRVCSHCEANHITLSEQAYARVKDQDFMFKSEIILNVKGKGDLTVYKTFKREKIHRRKSEKELSLDDNTPYSKNNQLRNVVISDGEQKSTNQTKSMALPSTQGNPQLTSNNLNELFNVPSEGIGAGSLTQLGQDKQQNNAMNNNNNNNVNNNNNNNSNNNSNNIPSISSINPSSRQGSHQGAGPNQQHYPPHQIGHYNRATTKKPSQYIRKSSFENLEQESTPSSKSKTFTQFNFADISPKRRQKRPSNTVIIPRASVVNKFDDLEIDEEETEPEKQLLQDEQTTTPSQEDDNQINKAIKSSTYSKQII